MNRSLLDRRRRLEAARGDYAAGGSPPPLRPEVEASWSRCSGELPVDLAAAPLDPGQVADRWEASLVRRAAPGLPEELARLADDGDMVAAVTDGAGHILWSAGGRVMARRAEQVNFTAGGRWDEASAGTNAPALCLLSGQPATVFSVEHWCEAVHDWVCYAAPVRGPDGDIVAVIDLSTTWQRANPLALSTVSALARLVEAQLRALPPTQAPPGPAVGIRALGHPRVAMDGTPLLLPLRQLEILCVLLLRPELSLDALHAHLYGDRPVSPTTLKAEISYLRRALRGAIGSRPYRVEARCDADFLAVVDHLRAGRVAEATAVYGGPFLPASESPALIEHRYYIDVALRDALLRTGSAADLVRFAAFHPDDHELLERAVTVAVPTDPVRREAETRLRVAELAMTYS